MNNSYSSFECLVTFVLMYSFANENNGDLRIVVERIIFFLLILVEYFFITEVFLKVLNMVVT